MSKLRLLALGALALLVAGVGVGLYVGRPKPVGPPSLLLVTIDTLRADRVGALGGPKGLTPNIDRLAASGLVFENAVSAVPLTLPAHATLLSGLDPLHHGVRNNGTSAFPADRETLATRLKAKGYATGAFVGAVVLDRRYGLGRGFDLYDDRIARATSGRSVLESERPCGDVADAAITWLRTRQGPSFAWVHFYEPHAPYSPPEDLAASHRGAPYDAEVAAADRCLGPLVEAARRSAPGGLVVAVAADHGEGLGEHGEERHGLFVYQSTLRVPVVISGRGVSASREKRLFRAADLLPTLLGVLGVAAPAGLDGHDARLAQATEAYAESEYGAGFGWAPLHSWRLGDLKFIEAPRPELYDLAQDPGELRNLADARPDDVTRLRGVLNRALESQQRADEKRASDEVEERLRSLGYVAAPAAEAPEGTVLTDPKDAVHRLVDFERAIEGEAADRTGAIGALQALVKREPGNVAFRRSLAGLLRRAGRAPAAVATLEEGARLSPRDASIAHDLALAYADAGDAASAITWEQRATAIDPDAADSLDHLAALQAQQGDFESARAAVERALALDGNNARAWVNRGNIARAQELKDEAEQSYKRALALSPLQPDALNGLGVLKIQAERFDEGAAHLQKAIEIEPGFAEARLNLAIAMFRLGHIPEAKGFAGEVARAAKEPALRERARAFLRDVDASGQ